MTETPLPTHADDPALEGWYHTIELGDGLVSKGYYDHRSVVDRYGIPDSLEGKTALDVGTWDGFWAFELEKRGAARVVALDIPSFLEFDWLPWIRERHRTTLDPIPAPHFEVAHALRGSRVERVVSNVYDLSPERHGMFDVVFCGDLLLHLQNPLKALVNIQSVTRELAIIETTLDAEIDLLQPGKPWVSFGHRRHEEQLGEAGIYWHLSTAALEEMMAYAGFASIRALPPFTLPPHPLNVIAVHGVPAEPADLGKP